MEPMEPRCVAFEPIESVENIMSFEKGRAALAHRNSTSDNSAPHCVYASLTRNDAASRGHRYFRYRLENPGLSDTTRRRRSALGAKRNAEIDRALAYEALAHRADVLLKTKTG